jgi:hypothetical protein
MHIGRDRAVDHEPADVVEVIPSGGGLHGEGVIVTTEGRAILAQIPPGRQLLTLDGKLGHGFRGDQKQADSNSSTG